MNAKRFNKIIDSRIFSIKQVLKEKNGDYAKGEKDVLHNFKVAGRVDDIQPETALRGMWLKHRVSIQDMLNEIENSSFNRTEEWVNEKIGDNINYLILLEALVKERINK